MNCTWEEHGLPDERGWRTVRCTRCNFITPKTPHQTDRIFRECEKMGLGDRIAALLAWLGITKAKVSEAIGQDCGCNQNQEALNELGAKVGL